jgi:hypothetical protein
VISAENGAEPATTLKIRMTAKMSSTIADAPNANAESAAHAALTIIAAPGRDGAFEPRGGGDAQEHAPRDLRFTIRRIADRIQL